MGIVEKWASEDIQRKNVTLHLILDSEDLANTQKALIWKLVPDQGFSFRLYVSTDR